MKRKRFSVEQITSVLQQVAALVHESCGCEGQRPGIRWIFSDAPAADQTGGMKSRVHPSYKTKYRVANWASYDRALVRRGDVTVWFSPAAIANWEPVGLGTRGAQLKYSDLAIETALTLRLLFNLPLR